MTPLFPKLGVLMAALTIFAITSCGSNDDDHSDKSNPRQNESSRRVGDGTESIKDAGDDDKNAPINSESESDESAPGSSAFAEVSSEARTTVNFEELSLADAIAVNWLNLRFDAPGTLQVSRTSGNINSGYRTTTEKVDHDWKILLTYLGYSRGRIHTYLNGQKIDSVHIYLVESESTNARKVYRYSSNAGLSNLGGTTFNMNLRLVHDRVAGKCIVDFYRYSAFSSADTLEPKSKYEGLEADCPVVNRSVADEVAFTKQKWELLGKAPYDGYTSNGTYEVLARVESYEFAAPWIRVYAGVDQHAYLSYSLDREASTQNIRVYTHKNGKRRSTFTKNVATGECTFTLTDAYFYQGMNLTGDCSLK